MTSEEVCHRVTFCHDPDGESREKRVWRLQAFSTLKNEIISRNVSFPPHLETLRTEETIQYPAADGSLAFNVATPNGEFPATFAFIGDASKVRARRRMDHLAEVIGEAKRTLVVWFRENGQLRYVCPKGTSDLTADLNESGRSYVGEIHE